MSYLCERHSFLILQLDLDILADRLFILLILNFTASPMSVDLYSELLRFPQILEHLESQIMQIVPQQYLQQPLFRQSNKLVVSDNPFFVSELIQYPQILANLLDHIIRYLIRLQERLPVRSSLHQLDTNLHLLLKLSAVNTIHHSLSKFLLPAPDLIILQGFFLFKSNIRREEKGAWFLGEGSEDVVIGFGDLSQNSVLLLGDDPEPVDLLFQECVLVFFLPLFVDSDNLHVLDEDDVEVIVVVLDDDGLLAAPVDALGGSSGVQVVLVDFFEFEGFVEGALEVGGGDDESVHPGLRDGLGWLFLSLLLVSLPLPLLVRWSGFEYGLGREIHNESSIVRHGGDISNVLDLNPVDHMLLIGILIVMYSPLLVVHLPVVLKQLYNTGCRVREMYLDPLRDNLFWWQYNPISRYVLHLIITELPNKRFTTILYKQKPIQRSKESKPIIKHFSLNNPLHIPELFPDVILLISSSVWIGYPVESFLEHNQQLFIFEEIKADDHLFQ